MKFLSVLVAIAVIGSSVGDSPFTTDVKAAFSFDTVDLDTKLDYVYQVETSSQNFENLNTVTDPDLLDWFENTRQYYVPFYTGIETRVNNAKSLARTSVVSSVAAFEATLDNVETKYQEMVGVFTSRSCSNFASYEADQKEILENFMGEVSSGVTSFTYEAKMMMPIRMLSQFAMKLMQAAWQFTPTTHLEAVQNVENLNMNQIEDTYETSSESTTEFIDDTVTAYFATKTGELNGILADMVDGAQTASCT